MSALMATSGTWTGPRKAGRFSIVADCELCVCVRVCPRTLIEYTLTGQSQTRVEREQAVTLPACAVGMDTPSITERLDRLARAIDEQRAEVTRNEAQVADLQERVGRLERMNNRISDMCQRVEDGMSAGRDRLGRMMGALRMDTE